MPELVERAVRAIQDDPDLRYYLGMRCGYHPDMLAMSVAGVTVGEVGACYRETLARVVREEGVAAVDIDVPHLRRETRASGDTVRIVEEAFDIRPMFHGLQLAVRGTVQSAAVEERLEEQVLAEVAACLIGEIERKRKPRDPPLAALANAPFATLIRDRARSSEGCTGAVSQLAIDFARSVAHAAIERADVASFGLVELEQMLGLRPRPVDKGRPAARLPAHTRPLPANQIFAGGVAAVPVNHATWALQNAIRDAILGHGWTDQLGRSAPTHVTRTNRRRGAVAVSVRVAGDLTPDTDELAGLWEQVRALDDLTADALLVCLAHWAAGDDDPLAPVWITADAILDARGRQRVRRRGEPGDWQHGHRREDRLAAGRALAQLDNLWLEIVDVEVIPAGPDREPRRLRAESRALAILDRISDEDDAGNAVFLAARVVPGEWSRSLAALGLKQTGLLARQTLGYDPYRERPEKWLARYLTFSFRWNASRRAPQPRLRVATLLENAALEPDPSRPQRTRDRLERALDRLRADGVIGGWQYERDPGDLPARHWLPVWTAMIVRIAPPEQVRKRYAGIGRAK